MVAVYVARTYPKSVCIRQTQSRHRITVLLCNLIGVLSLDVGVEMAFPSRRIVTERTFMGSLSRVREEVCLNIALTVRPKPTVLPRTPVLLLVGVRGLVLSEFAFLSEPCLATIHIARIGLHPRVPIVVIFESTTLRKPFSTPRKGTGKGPLSRVGPDMFLEITPHTKTLSTSLELTSKGLLSRVGPDMNHALTLPCKALSTPLEPTSKGLLSKVHRFDMSYDIVFSEAPIITLHIGTSPPLLSLL